MRKSNQNNRRPLWKEMVDKRNEIEGENSSEIVPQQPPKPRTLFTVKFGALTSWIRDISLIVLAWKLIAYISLLTSKISS